MKLSLSLFLIGALLIETAHADDTKKAVQTIGKALIKDSELEKAVKKQIQELDKKYIVIGTTLKIIIEGKVSYTITF